jgi:hypothetical protein
MKAIHVVQYPFGFADAIRAAAVSRAAFPTGLVLVLLTAVARSYDQTWIGEKPVLWLLGPLLFSLVSGTWLFLVTYAGFVRKYWPEAERSIGVWKDWRAFMGLFWLTAPVAWLYAIPVERFLDSLNAARANVALLLVVSLWRVVLFSRVIQVISGARYPTALMWVLLPASIEAMVVLVPNSMGEAIARGMGGLRHSPEEDVLLAAVEIVVTVALYSVIVCAVGSYLLRPRFPTTRLPPTQVGGPPWTLLAGCAVFWLVAAFWAQPSTARSARVDALVRQGQYLEAMDFLRLQSPDAFAPARPLPPKAYEHDTFRHLAGLLAEAEEDEPAWIQAHFRQRLDEVVDSTLAGRRSAEPGNPVDTDLTAQQLHNRLLVFWADPEVLHQLFAEGLGRLPWLKPWCQDHANWLTAWFNEAEQHKSTRHEWQEVAEALSRMGLGTSGPSNPTERVDPTEDDPTEPLTGTPAPDAPTFHPEIPVPPDAP